MKNKKISAEKFDEMFDDETKNILSYADIDSVIKRVNVDFPTWVIKKLDDESTRIGSSRQSVIRQLVIHYFDQKDQFEIEKQKYLNQKKG